MARGGASFTSHRCWSLPCQIRAFQLVSCLRHLKANQFSSVSIQCDRFLSLPSRFVAYESRRCLVPSRALSALPCPIVSRRVPSLRCRVGASLTDSSLRPSFPQLRRSPPIPSLPWLLAADLFRGCSAQVEALPCHSVASRYASIPVPSLPLPLWPVPICTIPQLLPFAPFFALPLHIPSILFISLAAPVNSTPGHLCSCHIVWPRRHSAAIRIVALPFHNHSHRLASIRCLLGSSHFRTLPCHYCSVQSLSRQFSAFASPFGSLPCHCLSAHLRLHRSWPFPCSSHRFGSRLCRLISTGCDALPYQIISATVSAEPFLCFSILR